jgi:NAD(P)-dependent dehydrogenase (short-subunit alcohol dehydrogenase family)
MEEGVVNRGRSDRFTLEGEVSLVTGGSGGIGAAVARAFAAAGSKVVVHYYHDADAATNVVRAIEAEGGIAVALPADVGELRDVEHLRDQIGDALGPVSILVSNAGLSSVKPFLDTTPQEWKQMISTNLNGFYNCVRTFAPAMVAANHGRIIATGSIGAEAAPPGEVTFVLSAGTKGGIMAMIRPLATEFGPHNVTVNCVSPGTTLSGMIDSEDEDIQEKIRRSTKLIPLGRHGKPDDIANAMLFLASEEAGFITGQTISVNGGFFYR